jgi:uncharacterized protein YcbX
VRLLPEGAVSHVDEGPLHLVTSASLAALTEQADVAVSTARLRPNLLIDVGRSVGAATLGDQVLVDADGRPLPP